MIARKTEIQLSPEARSLLGELFRSTEGQSILDAMAALCPRILTEGTAENMLASAHTHAGWEKAIEQLVEFTIPEAKAPEDKDAAYPDLDDEKAWEKQNAANA